MRIAILGSTSQIAKDLILSFSAYHSYELVLYARRPENVNQWLSNVGLAGRYAVADFGEFVTNDHFDAILNFVGVGDPAQAKVMGATIFDITLKYDELALNYIRQHPACRYIFLSSGSAYGSSFDGPVNEKTHSAIAINTMQVQDGYAVAKLHAECRHRALTHLSIVDLRIFNYFSHTQNIDARFLITDILRAIRDKTIFITSSDCIVRDFLHPSDFYQLINLVLTHPAANMVLDCYSKAPIDKFELLELMKERYKLNYRVIDDVNFIKSNSIKKYYYSENYAAAKINYVPQYTSKEGVLIESELSLIRKNFI